MKCRDVLVQKRIMRDFPKKGAWALVNKSVQHEACPEKPKEAVRATVDMNGIIFEEDGENSGTKLIWVVKCDFMGCAPRSVLNARSLRYPKIMQESLTKACSELMKGNLR